MIYFIGAGPGAADLITVKGKELLEKADLIIYAGSLVNPELLNYAKPECIIMDSDFGRGHCSYGSGSTGR